MENINKASFCFKMKLREVECSNPEYNSQFDTHINVRPGVILKKKKLN